MWASGHNGKIRHPAHGYEPTHEAAMAHSPRDRDRDKRLRFAILLSPWVAVVLALACPCASSFFGRHGRPPLIALIFALILSASSCSAVLAALRLRSYSPRRTLGL